MSKIAVHVGAQKVKFKTGNPFTKSGINSWKLYKSMCPTTTENTIHAMIKFGLSTIVLQELTFN